jgi:regulator of cell morphogenesis and NO signaling
MNAARSNAMTFDTIDECASTVTTPRTPQTLISFILERYHATHRRELAELCNLARRVEAVHATHTAAPHGLAVFLVAMLSDLEEHMNKEEQVLFPTLLAGGGGCAPFAMRRMRMEHEGHERHLEELSAHANGFVPPEDACGTWRALYAGCAKLHEDLRAHIALENEVLFPMFE